MSTLIHEELSKSIIGCAMTVLNELKPGLDEKLKESSPVLSASIREICGQNLSEDL